MTHEIRVHPDALEYADIARETWDDPAFDHRPGTIVNESQGGAPAGVDGDGDGGESGSDGGEQPAGLTLDDVSNAFDQRFDQLRQELPGLIGGEQGGEGGEGEESGEPDYEQLAQRFIEEAEQNGGEITPEDLQQFVATQSRAAVQQALEQALPQALEQALAPVHDRFLQQDADALEQRYPALSDPETQSEVVQEAVRFAQALGNPELARNPQVVEQAYLAWCARNGQTAAVPASGDRDAELEGGGGGNPGDAGDGPSIQDQIVNAGGRGGSVFHDAFS